jgi:hypothetical protein
MEPTSRPPLREESWIPEPILPSQFLDVWHRQKVLSPERELALAVLAQACDDLLTSRSARLYVETYQWVASDDRTWLYAFDNICDILNLSAERLRAELLRGGPRPPSECSLNVPELTVPLLAKAHAGRPSHEETVR